MDKLRYDVFISSKSEDYNKAEIVYDYLLQNGLSVFLASKELQHIGEAQYSQSIDKALDATTHMIVVASSLSHINSKWVQYEWRTFSNDLKSGYRQGNLLTILSDSVELGSLPASLRHQQSFRLDNFKNHILDYVKRNRVEDNFKTEEFPRRPLYEEYEKTQEENQRKATEAERCRKEEMVQKEKRKKEVEAQRKLEEERRRLAEQRRKAEEEIRRREEEEKQRKAAEEERLHREELAKQREELARQMVMEKERRRRLEAEQHRKEEERRIAENQKKQEEQTRWLEKLKQARKEEEEDEEEKEEEEDERRRQRRVIRTVRNQKRTSDIAFEIMRIPIIIEGLICLFYGWIYILWTHGLDLLFLISFITINVICVISGIIYIKRQRRYLNVNEDYYGPMTMFLCPIVALYTIQRFEIYNYGVLVLLAVFLIWAGGVMLYYRIRGKELW